MSLNRDDLIEALTYLREAGVNLVAWPDGPIDDLSLPLDLSPAEAVEYVTDPAGVVARRCGVSVNDLIAWREADGKYRCHAITCKGKRCRHVVAGEYWYAFERDPAKWASFERLGRCCLMHGRAAQGERP
ncbi:hypothetical protein [Cupriavidus metallidurans]|uniref:hypothetical protein n=1 Tax=Cupriavidus metallidurans TaxID=119219 RepID=UPI000CE07017|nr:hypothetical protein [Cupriavidus metallidurans]AVA33430.1 hypothetical protein C3Z06_07190 [Cupriavidus metallidurans]